MKPAITLFLTTFFLYQSSFSQNIPGGYLLQYEQNFSAAKALNDFTMNNPTAWGIYKVANNFHFRCAGADSVKSIPANIAILNNKVFGDFILEADVIAGNDSSEIHEACLFLGVRDLTKYYYVQLANLADSVHHGIFLIKDTVISKLTDGSEDPVAWSESKWHKVRLERNIIKRTILVYVDDMTNPLMQVKNYELVMGAIGIGTFSGSARFDNIKIWAPTVITDEELKLME